ncbi:LCP family protein, partial [Actinomyces sp. 217892]
LGTDSRETVPEGPDYYGTVAQAGQGSRADVLLLVQPSASGTTIVSVPRDLALLTDAGAERLATSRLAGPGRTVDLLCTQLGVAPTHVVAVDMAQFAAVVDALGGVSVAIDEPVRDAGSGLDLSHAGEHTLTGVEALSLVRSRHPEVLHDGQWTALSQTEGAQRRSHYAGVVLAAVLAQARHEARNPLAARNLAHTLAGNLTVDPGTGLTDLLGLARTVATGDGASVTLVEIPVDEPEGSFVAFPTQETYAVLAAHGYLRGGCVPAAGQGDREDP